MRLPEGGRAGRREKRDKEREYESYGKEEALKFISTCFLSSNLKKKNPHTELLWTGSRGEGVFQFDQRASLETRTADGVVSLVFLVWFGAERRRERIGRRRRRQEKKATVTFIERERRTAKKKEERRSSGEQMLNVCFFSA